MGIKRPKETRMKEEAALAQFFSSEKGIVGCVGAFASSASLPLNPNHTFYAYK